MREINISTLMSLSNDSFFLVCMTTPCPIAGWPLVTWKGSGAHVPPFVLRNPSPSAQETPAVQVQLDQRAKMKEPSFHYMA
ncbi:unnamed protein product [Spirodela intermedia]|uniref:Uncharacterized protein n=1 Tax=Spirodela intermedia TaxID=51605 RepID=A0A7I8KVH8_SPIIN|nr:unnamed protein product [Spirodela intermedia]